MTFPSIFAAPPFDPAAGASAGGVVALPHDDPRAILARREWEAHLDAGRIGGIGSRSSPDRLASEARCREMERVLGIRRGGVR